MDSSLSAINRRRRRGRARCRSSRRLKAQRPSAPGIADTRVAATPECTVPVVSPRCVGGREMPAVESMTNGVSLAPEPCGQAAPGACESERSLPASARQQVSAGSLVEQQTIVGADSRPSIQDQLNAPNLLVIPPTSLGSHSHWSLRPGPLSGPGRRPALSIPALYPSPPTDGRGDDGGISSSRQ